MVFCSSSPVLRYRVLAIRDGKFLLSILPVNYIRRRGLRPGGNGSNQPGTAVYTKYKYFTDSHSQWLQLGIEEKKVMTNAMRRESFGSAIPAFTPYHKASFLSHCGYRTRISGMYAQKWNMQISQRRRDRGECRSCRNFRIYITNKINNLPP